MIKYDAIGIVETLHYAVAVEMLDEMLKSANVELIHKESALGGRLVTLFVGGKTSDVNEAIETANSVNDKKGGEVLKSAITISKPHEEIMKYIVPSNKEKNI